MQNIETQVEKWYKANVNQEEIDRKVMATLDYVKRSRSETKHFTIFAYEIVKPHHKKIESRRILLDKILCQGEPYYTKEQNSIKYNEVMKDYQVVKRLVTEQFNKHSKLTDRYYVDFNVADGSLGLICSAYV